MIETAVLIAIIGAFVSLIAAIAPTITAYAALQQGKRNALATETLTKKTDENTAITSEVKHQSDGIVKSTDKIYEHTNSSLTKIKEELAAANQQIKDLQSLMQAIAEKDLELARKKKQLENPAPPATETIGIIEHVEKLDIIEAIGEDTSGRVKRIEKEVVKVQDDVSELTTEKKS